MSKLHSARKMQFSRSQPKSSTLQLEATEKLEKLNLERNLQSGKNSPSACRSTLSRNFRRSNKLLKVSSEKQSPKHKAKSSMKSSSRPKIEKLVTQAPSKAGSSFEVSYKEHLFQTFQSLKFIKTLLPIDQSAFTHKLVYLPMRKGFENRRTIVFDLDETLVHCLDSTSMNPDVVLPIKFPNGEVINAGINVRPYARECLKEASKLFEVIVFTASHQCYADVVLDYLDPEHEYIHHRLYRDNCIVAQGVFIKDLRILTGRNTDDVVIVDNATYSFGYQLFNGVPIISWSDDPNDRELFNLIDYMKILARANSIQDVNKATFRLDTFYDDYVEEFMGKRPKTARRKASKKALK